MTFEHPGDMQLTIEQILRRCMSSAITDDERCAHPRRVLTVRSQTQTRLQDEAVWRIGSTHEGPRTR